jgi:hypothetical protein
MEGCLAASDTGAAPGAAAELQDAGLHEAAGVGIAHQGPVVLV